MTAEADVSDVKAEATSEDGSNANANGLNATKNGFQAQADKLVNSAELLPAYLIFYFC